MFGVIPPGSAVRIKAHRVPAIQFLARGNGGRASKLQARGGHVFGNLQAI